MRALATLLGTYAELVPWMQPRFVFLVFRDHLANGISQFVIFVNVFDVRVPYVMDMESIDDLERCRTIISSRIYLFIGNPHPKYFFNVCYSW